MQREKQARRVVMAMVLIPTLLVSGCTGSDPVDRSTPAWSAAPTPTPSATPTVDRTRLPDRPAAMAEPTTDGAIAAATHVMDLLAYTFASGDTGPWAKITADSCVLCAGVVKDVTAMTEAGQKSSGYDLTISEPTAIEISDDEWFSVEMRVVQGPSQRFDAEGKVVGTGTGGTYDAVFALSWADGWTVDEMGLEEADPAQAGE